MTALHWCAKRNYCEPMRILASYGADVNAKDASGRTPVYIAAKQNNDAAVKELLGLQADPFLRCIKKLSAEDVTQDDELRALIKKGKMFKITN